jgi:hypothetical protein
MLRCFERSRRRWPRPDVQRSLALAVFAWVGLPRAGIADEANSALDFAVDYQAASTCPAKAQFEAAVLSRVPGARVVPEERASVRFRVELSDPTRDKSSSIWIGVSDGSSTRRDVDDASCAEAAASMAVIAAMVLDGRRTAEQGPAPAPEPITNPQPSPVTSGTPTAKPRPSAAPKARAQPRNAVMPAPSSAESPRAEHDGASLSERESRSAGRLSAGAALAGTWESEVAPTAPLGILAALEARWQLEPIWSPSVRLGLLYTVTATETSDDGTATFQLLAIRLSACPVRFGRARSLALFACADFDAGELRAKGTHTLNERTQSMPWLAAGPGLRGELPLGKMLVSEALIGARFLANHDRFVFEPDAVVHDVARVSFGLGIGLSGHVP